MSNSDSRIARGAARLTLRGSDGIAKSSFDARNTKSISKTLGTGGGAGKGGYISARDEKEKRYTERAKNLDPSTISVQRSENDLKLLQDSRKLAQQKGMPTANFDAQIKTAQAKVDNLKGVDDKEALKRAKRIYEERAKTGGKYTAPDKSDAKFKDPTTGKLDTAAYRLAKEEYEEKIKAKTARLAKRYQQDSLGDKRRKEYAKSVENTPRALRWLSGDSYREKERQAAAVRSVMKKKKAEDLIDEALRATGQIT